MGMLRCAKENEVLPSKSLAKSCSGVAVSAVSHAELRPLCGFCKQWKGRNRCRTVVRSGVCLESDLDGLWQQGSQRRRKRRHVRTRLGRQHSTPWTFITALLMGAMAIRTDPGTGSRGHVDGSSGDDDNHQLRFFSQRNKVGPVLGAYDVNAATYEMVKVERRRRIMQAPITTKLPSSSSLLSTAAALVFGAKSTASDNVFASQQAFAMKSSALQPLISSSLEDTTLDTAEPAGQRRDDTPVRERGSKDGGRTNEETSPRRGYPETLGPPLPGEDAEIVNNNGVQPSDRIVGGTEARRGRYEYMVSLTANGSHRCGGTLIAPDAVLTAAHCLVDDGIPIDGVQIGRHDIYGDLENFESYVVRQPLEPHPNYEDYEQDPDRYDVAVVWMYGTSNRNPVRLNWDAETPSTDGGNLTVIGWGSTAGVNDQLNDVLLEVEVKYVEPKVCAAAEGFVSEDSFVPYLYSDVLYDEMMCAADKGKDACPGDSGGPLLVLDERNDTGVDPKEGYNDTQVGVVAFGVGCAREDFPGIYTRVSSVSSWIRDRICNMSTDPPESLNCNRIAIESSGADTFVTVKIKLDFLPGETGWLIQRVRDMKIIAFAQIGTYEGMEEREVEHEVELESSFEYKFIMLDSEGDGICCFWTNGFYRLYNGAEASGDVLVNQEGKYLFSASEHLFFVKPPPETSSEGSFRSIQTPSPAPLYANHPKSFEASGNATGNQVLTSAPTPSPDPVSLSNIEENSSLGQSTAPTPTIRDVARAAPSPDAPAAKQNGSDAPSDLSPTVIHSDRTSSAIGMRCYGTNPIAFAFAGVLILACGVLQ